MADMTPMGDLAQWFKIAKPANAEQQPGWGAMPNWANTQEAKEELAAIMEYDGNLSRQDAETAAGVKSE